MVARCLTTRTHTRTWLHASLQHVHTHTHMVARCLTTRTHTRTWLHASLQHVHTHAHGCTLPYNTYTHTYVCRDSYAAHLHARILMRVRQAHSHTHLFTPTICIPSSNTSLRSDDITHTCIIRTHAISYMTPMCNTRAHNRWHVHGVRAHRCPFTLTLPLSRSVLLILRPTHSIGSRYHRRLLCGFAARSSAQCSGPMWTTRLLRVTRHPHWQTH